MAEALVRRLPRTLASLERAEIDELKATKIVESTVVLSDVLARRADEIIVRRLTGKDSGSLRRAVNRVVLSLDPDGYRARSLERRRCREVRLRPEGETMSRLAARLPVEQASAIYASVDRAARELRRVPGEGRTTGQLRADVFADRLLVAHGGDASVRADIQVQVDLMTLAGLNQEPAELAGYGSIPAWLARRIATSPSSTWTRLITDADTGHHPSVGRDTYRPPSEPDCDLRVRDRECATPGCRRPARFAELDHADERHGERGESSADALDGHCAFHREVKREPGERPVPRRNGSDLIVTPTGRKYTHHAQPFHEPRTRRSRRPAAMSRSRRRTEKRKTKKP
ncbi:HNH endonuclease signature motif containing protein [Amycolatopsis samaneae]